MKCLICKCNATINSHDVCQNCLDKVKLIYIKPIELIFEKQNERKVADEVREKNVLKRLEWQQEEWEHFSRDGVTAKKVAIEILDGIESNLAWHKRRVNYVMDCINQVDKSEFLPATSTQVSDYLASASKYWKNELSKFDAIDLKNTFSDILGKTKRDNSWDIQNLLLWLMTDEEFFDWIWHQYFEYVSDSLRECLNDAQIFETMYKHFSIEIMDWSKIKK